MTPTTTTTTGISIRSASDGQRSVAVRTATTVRTGPDFREQLAAACAPARAAAPSRAPEPSRAERTSDLQELIQQLLERLRAFAQGGHHATGSNARTGRPHAPAGPAGCVNRHTPPAGPAGTTPRVPAAESVNTMGRPSVIPNSAPSAESVNTMGRPAVRPSRVFEVRDPAAPGKPSGAHIRVRGTIALEEVTEGAKLDEGIRRMAGFLSQIGDHTRAGGTFTDDQLQSIADEAMSIYREAIRATTGATDQGDYTSASRDGVLDLGSSTSAIALQAKVSSATPLAA